MTIDLDLLPTFAVFAETLGFTAAGRQLGLTQPAVHGQVRRLADAIGDPLYVRRGGQLVLTARGRELASFAREVVVRRDAFFSQQAPPVRLAAGRGAWTWVLPQTIGAWLRRARVQPLVMSGAAAVEAVIDGRAELGVATGPPSTVTSRIIHTAKTHVLVPSSHPLADLPEVATDQLGGPWVLPAAGRPHRVLIEERLRSAGVAWDVPVESSDWAVTSRFVALGMGIAAVNDFVEPAPGCVAVAWPEGPVHDYALFCRTDRELPVDVFAD